mgnify:FL=1|jgi:hypothetical protein
MGQNNFICVLWGAKYSEKYVETLYNMVKRNTTLPFNFYCLTDRDHKAFTDNIKSIRIPDPQLQHWWNKMHLYNPELGLEGNCLYIDLDVVIVGNLDEFFTFGKDEDFCVIRDFGQPSTTINSSVLRFNQQHHNHIWKTYIERKDTFDKLHGDQNVITDLMWEHKQKVYFPDEWTYSYKWPERGKPKKYDKYKPDQHPLKTDSKICVFHGHPNPDYAMKYQSGEWIKDLWR